MALSCRDKEAPTRPQERGGHRVVPVEGAAPEVKDLMKLVLEERENILLCKAENEKQSQDLLKQMEAAREKTVAAFREERQFLEEQEKLLKAQMEEVGKEIVRKREEPQATVSAELPSFNTLIQELEEKWQQSKKEPLENPGDILGRFTRKSSESRVAFPVALKWRIHDFCCQNAVLVGLMKQFRENLISGLRFQQANVILDPDTAHYKLILSENCKSVRFSEEGQDVPYSWKRFTLYPFVLGREGFTAGRHFWEVTLGSEGEWTVGVARMSVRRNRRFDSTTSGVWALGKWRGQCRLLKPTLGLPLTLCQDLKRIRVTLNYAGGQVAFFDADTGVHLDTYSGASFCGETLLPFFSLLPGGRLTLSS